MPEDTDLPYVVGASGRRLYVDPADERAQELVRAEGTLTPGSNRLWDAVLALTTWDVVVDVGANYGEMVLGAEIGADARIVCFEPNPQVVPFLRRSIEESAQEIELREVALEAVTVPVSTLDEELSLADHESVCVKVDVEGAEFDVLDGARSLTSSSRRWAIMLEVLHMDAFEKARLATGYTMRVMDRRSGDLVVVPPATPQRVGELLDSGWLHSQDVVVTAREAA